MRRFLWVTLMTTFSTFYDVIMRHWWRYDESLFKNIKVSSQKRLKKYHSRNLCSTLIGRSGVLGVEYGLEDCLGVRNAIFYLSMLLRRNTYQSIFFLTLFDFDFFWQFRPNRNGQRETEWSLNQRRQTVKLHLYTSPKYIPFMGQGEIFFPEFPYLPFSE